VDHAANEGAERARIARIKFLQRVLSPLGDFLHQHFIADERSIRAVELGKDFREYRHSNDKFGREIGHGYKRTGLLAGKKNPDGALPLNLRQVSKNLASR